jgi:hypothetical protein
MTSQPETTEPIEGQVYDLTRRQALSARRRYGGKGPAFIQELNQWLKRMPLEGRILFVSKLFDAERLEAMEYLEENGLDHEGVEQANEHTKAPLQFPSSK